jgi:hypothetical protein
MFVVRLNVPSGKEFDLYIQRSLKAQGGAYAGVATISYTQTEFTPTIVQLRQAMDAGANVIAFHGATGNAIGFFNALSKTNIRLPIIGIFAVASPDLFKKLAPDFAKHVTAVASMIPALSGVPGGKDIRAFVAANPSYATEAQEPLFTEGWLTGQIFEQAAERAARDNDGILNRATLFEGLKTRFETGELSCTLDFTHQNYTPCATVLSRDGNGLVAKDGFAAFEKVLQRKYGL